MPIEPATNAVRIAISDILSKFLGNYENESGLLAALRDEVYSRYKPIPVDDTGLHGILNNSSGVEMKDNHLFLFLKPIEKENILPLVTLQSSDDWVHFRIYTLLTMLDKCSTLQALAIRFETDEGYRQPESKTDSCRQPESKTGSHDFCHAQLCNAINSRIPVLTPEWIPDSQPSIPLDADNQVSLVLCMLTSLYGGKCVFNKLRKSGDRDLQKHLKEVRALRAFMPTN